MIVDVLNRINESDTRDEGERRAHAALFAHVGVTDPTDWQAVAVALACRYSPGLLMDPKPCSSAGRTKKVGRPKEWDEMAFAGLLYIIEEIQQHSREKLIGRNLATQAAACEFFANDEKAESYRSRAYMIPRGLTAETYQNKLSMARRMRAKMASSVTETATGYL